jgi:hypothetical protein
MAKIMSVTFVLFLLVGLTIMSDYNVDSNEVGQMTCDQLKDNCEHSEMGPIFCHLYCQRCKPRSPFCDDLDIVANHV